MSDIQTVRLGTQTVKFPSAELGQLEDSNSIVDDREALHNEIQDKGYLYIRGLHDRQEVLDARLAVLQYIVKCGEGKIATHQPWEEGVLEQRCGIGCLPFMEGKNDITHSDAVAKVLEGPRPFKFFKTFFGEDAKSFDYKWLRAVHREAFTGAHVDSVYMARGTSNLLTMWTPFADYTPTIGALAVCEGSHRLPGFEKFQATYGNLDAEAANLKGTGWFTCDPFEITSKFGGQWKTSNFKAGDVLIFTMRTVHMSTANLTDLVRISCDTRWQPASEPADPRYTGETFALSSKFGLHGSTKKEHANEVTIEELRAKWGLQ